MVPEALSFSTDLGSLSHWASKSAIACSRVAAINCTIMPVAHENRPEPGFARWGLLRTHDVPNAVFSVEDCEAVTIIRLRCTYESQH